MLLATALTTSNGWAEQPNVVSGKVIDVTGASVAGAKVSADCSPSPVYSDSQGQFSVRCGQPISRLHVSAQGFQNQELTSIAVPLVVTLRPATRNEVSTVTGTLAPMATSETAQSITSITAAELRSSPQPTVDDALRNVAGFSLFRRSGSRVANPTSQGASLRGVGASGASRTLVLYDGVPLNDPFGGWVYWSRVGPETVSGIEVLQGGGSDIYGDQALSGVVNIFARRPEGSLRFTSEGGMLGSYLQAASGGVDFDGWRLSGFGELAATDGYILVPPELRGAIDTPANARHSSGEVRIQKSVGQASAFLAASGFGERRDNGTHLQSNDTQLFQLRTGVDFNLGSGDLSVRVDGSGQSYNQSFSAIASDRDSETLARLQHVPAQQVGGRAVWLRRFGDHAISVGGDLRSVRGFTHETIFIAGTPSSFVEAGGHQLFGGAFIQDSWRVHPRLTLSASVRGDAWSNDDASSRTTTISGVENRITFSDRSDAAFDPRLSVVFHPGDGLSLFATGYRSFRAPRLNELYRAFRLGNVLTLANPDLKAERLTGVDAGIGGTWKIFNVRATFFFARVTNPVANVTESVTPSLITRIRQNVGALESKGLQLTASTKFGASWSWRGDYQFADARITKFAPNPQLIDNRVPQVPAHAFATSLTFDHAGWTAVLNGRITSQQFDDDLNLFDLGGASSFDAYGSRRWNSRFETFIAAENLLDSRDFIARAPTPNLSLPFTLRGGVRLTIGRTEAD